MPVEKVPKLATIIASFCPSTILRIASLSAVSVSPDTKNTFLLSSVILLIN
jgi:hypothetical protein